MRFVFSISNARSLFSIDRSILTLGGTLTVLTNQCSRFSLCFANTYAQALLSSFVRFVADGDKEALVAALLSVLGQHNPKLAGPVSSPEEYSDDEEHDSVTGACKCM
jgi:uncharacterized protein YejL (UPF0352 family)